MEKNLEAVLRGTVNGIEALWDKLNAKSVKDYNDDIEKILEPLYATLSSIEVPEGKEV